MPIGAALAQKAWAVPITTVGGVSVLRAVAEHAILGIGVQSKRRMAANAGPRHRMAIGGGPKEEEEEGGVDQDVDALPLELVESALAQMDATSMASFAAAYPPAAQLLRQEVVLARLLSDAVSKWRDSKVVARRGAARFSTPMPADERWAAKARSLILRVAMLPLPSGDLYMEPFVRLIPGESEGHGGEPRSAIEQQRTLVTQMLDYSPTGSEQSGVLRAFVEAVYAQPWVAGADKDFVRPMLGRLVSTLAANDPRLTTLFFERGRQGDRWSILDVRHSQSLLGSTLVYRKEGILTLNDVLDLGVVYAEGVALYRDVPNPTVHYVTEMVRQGLVRLPPQLMGDNWHAELLGAATAADTAVVNAARVFVAERLRAAAPRAV